jgi:hypothetical protein
MGSGEPKTAVEVDWERIAREAVLHVIRHREDFHNPSHRPCGTCDRSAAFLRTLPPDVARPYTDTSCTAVNGRG